MKSKSKDSKLLSGKIWKLGLACPFELTMLLTVLKSSAPGVGPSNHAVQAFQAKLNLYETAGEHSSLTELPTTVTQIAHMVVTITHYTENLSTLIEMQHFADLKAQKCDFELLSNPFGTNVQKVH